MDFIVETNAQRNKSNSLTDYSAFRINISFTQQQVQTP